MKEILRTNDAVRLSFAQSLLRDADIEPIVLDAHSSVMDGSIPFIQRRIMVADEDADRARALLKDGLPE